MLKNYVTSVGQRFYILADGPTHMLIMQRPRIFFFLLAPLLCALLPGLAVTRPASAAAPPAAAIAVADAATRDLAGVRAAERRRAQAIASRDVATLRNLVSGDYYHVETNGRVRTKSELLQLLERDAYEFRSYDVSDVEIRLLDGGRAALVTGRLNADLQQPNRSGDFRGRFVRMWQWSPEGWRNTMHQSTEIRAALPPREIRPQP